MVQLNEGRSIAHEVEEFDGMLRRDRCTAPNVGRRTRRSNVRAAWKTKWNVRWLLAA